MNRFYPYHYLHVKEEKSEGTSACNSATAGHAIVQAKGNTRIPTKLHKMSFLANLFLQSTNSLTKKIRKIMQVRKRRTFSNSSVDNIIEDTTQNFVCYLARSKISILNSQ